MRIIDGHIHAGRWSPNAFCGRGVEFEEIDKCLEECGLDGGVLTSTDLRENDKVLEFINRTTKRYWFFPWVNPASTDDLSYLRQRLSRIHGMKLHPSCDKIRVNDKRVVPYIEFARDQNLPVMIHCGRWQEMSSYKYAIEVAARYPECTFILSHMGGDTPELEMATIEAVKSANLKNVFLGIEGVREYWAVEEAISQLGADRVIFGSDFPLGHPKMYLALVEVLRISDGERSKILGENILRILGQVT